MAGELQSLSALRIEVTLDDSDKPIPIEVLGSENMLKRLQAHNEGRFREITELRAKVEKLEHARQLLLETVSDMSKLLGTKPRAVGEVTRTGSDSHGRPWHGIYWYDPDLDVPHGTKLFIRV